MVDEHRGGVVLFEDGEVLLFQPALVADLHGRPHPGRQPGEGRLEAWQELPEGELLDAKVGELKDDAGQLLSETGRTFEEQVQLFRIVSEHLEYVKTFSARNNINNVQAVLGGDNDIGLKDEKVDVAWMCSLYHIVYVAFNEKDKDAFIGSIMKALKDDGTFYVVDNGLVPEGVLPYHAPYIDKSLIIGQLQAYGFRLVKDYQFIPQRYILAFKKK